MKKYLCSFIIMFFLPQAFAVTLKIGVLAPEGTNWANNLRKLAREIKKATDGNVKLKMYLGGVAGDEPDVLRKVRIGQLHGGIFTGRTLGEIYGDVRVIELPFNFRDNRKEAWRAIKMFEGEFNAGFTKNGFKNLGFFEIGNVYVVSTKPFNSIDKMKGIKVWSWEGDVLAASMVEALNLVSVPLALPDVLSSLSTGIIEAAYSPPLAVIALQWQTKVKYFIDFPVTFSMGAFLLSEKAWSKVPEKYRAKVEEITTNYVNTANERTAVENKEAKEALRSLGIKFIKFSDADLAKQKEVREKVINKLKGKLLSEAVLKKFNKNFGDI